METPERYEVYSQNELHIAAGDKIRFSLGGTTRDGKGRISNGRLDEVKGFDKSGNLILKNGKVIDKNYGHLDLGYVITSHASQGKDRKLALAAMGANSLPAINAKQFYVTVSRGSEDVAIYVDDKSRVRRSIERSGQQLSATEMNRAGQASERGHDTEAALEMFRRGQQAVRGFRDRLVRWWQSKSNDREQEVHRPIGRHREAEKNNRDLGSGNPGIERSR